MPKNEVKNKIPNITNLVTTSALSTKIDQVKNNVSNITNLATTATALTAAENKIPNVRVILSKKTDYNTKNNETENKITAHHALHKNEVFP